MLIDEIGEDTKHPLYGFMDTLGTLLHAYEEEHIPVPQSRGMDVLQFLMEEHGVSPSDLPELGAPSEIADLLNGRTELTLPQIRHLSRRFHLSPAVFI
jgi:HTH-type transcriptional regulator/antitoxin HigA